MENEVEYDSSGAWTSIGLFLLLVGIVTFIITLIAGADERFAKKTISNSYAVTGEVTRLSDIDMIVNHLHKSKDDSSDRYKIEWKQDVTITFVDNYGNTQAYENRVVVKEVTESIGESNINNSASHVEDMYKNQVVYSNYQLGQKIDLYVDKNDSKSIYEKADIDKRSDTGKFRKNVRTISFVAFVLAFACFIFDRKKR